MLNDPSSISKEKQNKKIYLKTQTSFWFLEIFVDDILDSSDHNFM